MGLGDREDQVADAARCEGVDGDAARRGVDGRACRPGAEEGRRAVGFHADDPHAAREVGGDPGDEAATADRGEHRVKRPGLVVELKGDGGLAEYGLPLVIGVHAHRA